MFPHERSLVQRLEKKPFALIGVNGDNYDDAFKKQVEKHKISWRSFKNERKGQPDIADAWNVEGWPTLYLIDAKGVIRQVWVGSPGDETLDREIDKLVAEAEKK